MWVNLDYIINNYLKSLSQIQWYNKNNINRSKYRL